MALIGEFSRRADEDCAAPKIIDGPKRKDSPDVDSVAFRCPHPPPFSPQLQWTAKKRTVSVSAFAVEEEKNRARNQVAINPKKRGTIHPESLPRPVMTCPRDRGLLVWLLLILLALSVVWTAWLMAQRHRDTPAGRERRTSRTADAPSGARYVVSNIYSSRCPASVRSSPTWEAVGRHFKKRRGFDVVQSDCVSAHCADRMGWCLAVRGYPTWVVQDRLSGRSQLLHHGKTPDDVVTEIDEFVRSTQPAEP